MTLKRGDDIQLCENRGRYLYLLAEPAAESPVPAAAPKRRGRKTPCRQDANRITFNGVAGREPPEFRKLRDFAWTIYSWIK